jgi:hypothetical protein
MHWANGFPAKPPIAVQLHLPLSIEARSNAWLRMRFVALLNSLRSLKSIWRCAVARAPLPLNYSLRMMPLGIGTSSTNTLFVGLSEAPNFLACCLLPVASSEDEPREAHIVNPRTLPDEQCKTAIELCHRRVWAHFDSGHQDAISARLPAISRSISQEAY